MYNCSMDKKRRGTIRNIVIVLLAFFVLYWIGIYILVSAVLVPSFMEKLSAFERIAKQSYAEQVQESELQKNNAAMYLIGKHWAENCDPEPVEVISEDGYRLKGMIFRAEEAAGSEEGAAEEAQEGEIQEEEIQEKENREDDGNDHWSWVILLHGYTGSKEMMYPYAYWYVKHGYHVLTPDFRCQGESEGDYIGLGATDSRDLDKWIELILEQDPEADIILHGLSMGASTALIHSERPNGHIKAVISDCAFTDAYSMFREKVWSWFHLPAFPVIDSARLMIRIRAGYDLKETSPLKAVEHSSVPTLFIHGREDRMIPFHMCKQLYDAAACDKEIMIVDGAGHAQAVDRDPAGYWNTIECFLEKYAELH